MTGLAGAGDWVWLARILRPQGRKGEVFSEILTDFPEKFAERRQLWLLGAEPVGAREPMPRPVQLAGHWLHKGGVVLHFAGVDSIAAAEALRGLVVGLPRAERAVLPEDEVYIGDLIGCALVDVAAGGADVDRTAGPVALLMVRGAAGEVLIPFARSYLRKIDLEARRVEMALPEGLTGLNAPRRPEMGADEPA
ncbi:MAG: ribosome maturation factor RimM [Terracidiphilus sp.]